MSRRSLATRGERARAAAAALAVNLFLGIAFVTGLALREEQRSADSLQTFDVAIPPPPPPIVEKPQPDEAAPEKEGAEGRKAEAASVVAQPSPIPRPTPVVAAQVPSTGSAPSAGAGERGTGPGSGGSGSGVGGGGDGAGGLGSEAQLLGGNRARLPSALLRAIPQERGYAHLLLTVGSEGRVVGCEVLTSSGYAAVDQVLCGVMLSRSRWAPARDRAGRPVTVQLRYTATWSKN